MTPWQVALGLCIATLIPVWFLLLDELAYLSGYWPWLWEHWWFQISLFVATGVMVWFFGIYQLARTFSLGDVGSRLRVLDESFKSGVGDQELAEALRRESEGNYRS